MATKLIADDVSKEEGGGLDTLSGTVLGTKKGLDVSSADHLLAVAAGNVSGQILVNKFGANGAVGTTWESITSDGIYRTPTALTSLEIVSDDNTNDISSGTGARKVTIIGLSTGWTEVTEEVSLNGTTAVALANQYFRVYRMYVSESGAYATAISPSHDSTITLRVSGAGDEWASINTDGSYGLGQSEIGAFSVPDGYIAYLMNYNIDVESNKAVDVALFTRESADDVSTPFSGVMRVKAIKRAIDGSHKSQPHGPILSLVGPADIGFLGKVSSGSAKLEVEFQILLIADT